MISPGMVRAEIRSTRQVHLPGQQVVRCRDDIACSDKMSSVFCSPTTLSINVKTPGKKQNAGHFPSVLYPSPGAIQRQTECAQCGAALG